MKICPVGAEFLCGGETRDRNDGVNSSFLQFCKYALKKFYLTHRRWNRNSESRQLDGNTHFTRKEIHFKFENKIVSALFRQKLKLLWNTNGVR